MNNKNENELMFEKYAIALLREGNEDAQPQVNKYKNLAKDYLRTLMTSMDEEGEVWREVVEQWIESEQITPEEEGPVYSFLSDWLNEDV